MPAVFYFALTAEQSLTLSPINSPAAFLSLKKVRIFSWSLFAHDNKTDPKESMVLWARALKSNSPFVSEFIKTAQNNLSYLIEKKWIKEDAIAACGLSRGGFLSTHWAASDPRIQVLVGFAPLINVHSRGVFAELNDSSFARSLDLIHLKDKLSKTYIGYYTGNHDQSTGTMPVMELVKAISDTAYTKKIRSPQTHLFVYPSVGHKGHGTAPHIFYSGSEFISNFFFKKRKYFMKYSLIIPLKNEEDNVIPLIEEITHVMQSLGEVWEVICVNDGSSDQTHERLELIKKQTSCLHIISFEKNFGQSSAFKAGFEAAKGEILISLDGDGQNDPNDIPKLLEELNHHDMVVGWRKIESTLGLKK